MIHLYDYQQDGYDQIIESLKKGHTRILRQSPTGAGKTVEFCDLVLKMKQKNKRALIITDRIELLFETGGTLQKFGLHPYHILAGQMAEPLLTHQVYIAMSQTLRRRIGKWNKFFQAFDVVIMDEVHKQEFNPYFEMNAFPEKTMILGFTATPLRTGKQRQLGQDFEYMVEGLQIPELIKRKKLVPDKYFGVQQHADMYGVRINSFGDYQESGMFERFNKRELYAGAVENWKTKTPGTITLGFCVNIQHTIETCKAFNDAGIKAKFLVSDLAKPELTGSGEAARVRYEMKMCEYENYQEAMRLYSGNRNIILQQWKRGDFKVLFNAGILTTGFNYPAIETIIINRATTSIPLWLQMLGRGSRIFPGKTHFNILDFGDNANRLGYYNQQREWALWHEISKGGGAQPVKECGKMNGKSKIDENLNPGCGAYIFASQMICPYCGYVFKYEKQEKFAELIEIDYLNLKMPEKTFKSEIEQLERDAESRGYKFGWIINMIISKHGEEGLKEYASSKGYQRGWFEMTKRRYEKQIEKYNEKQLA